MRVIVTKLMDKGLPRRSRAMPEDALMRSFRDKEGRLVYQLYYPDRGGIAPIVGSHLIAPQCGDIGDRTAVYFGFERAGGDANGPLVAQAWEVELPSRR
jgi:hypothetical protein